MKINLDNIVKRFVVNEGNVVKPSLQSFLESLSKLSEMLRPSSARDRKLLEILRQQLREVKLGVKKLMEENQQLQEQVKVLEEEKNKKKKLK